MTKEEKREYNRKYRAEHKEEIAAQKREYRAAHKDKIAEYNAAYYIENKDKALGYAKTYRLEHKEEIAAKGAEYRAAHKEEINAKRAAYDAAYRAAHKEEEKERKKRYAKTIDGRASKLHNRYRCFDISKGFDVSNVVTSDWLMEHVLTKPCVYCGEDDWKKMGADRIDNTKPHTPDNCVPCCHSCNCARARRYTFEEFKEYRKNNPKT